MSTPTILLLLTPVLACAQPQFVDVSAEAGLNHTHGEQLGNRESMTGGVAARDFDADGWTDLVFTRLNDPPILYRNTGNGTFEDITPGSGLEAMPSHSNAAAWGDIDNDGKPDLYLTSVEPGQPNHLFINLGGGVFAEQSAKRNAGAQTTQPIRFSTSAALGDFDRDGSLDIHTTEWGNPLVSPPGVSSHARLLRNLGSKGPGQFVDATLAWGALLDDQLALAPVIDPGLGAWSFASRFSDLDLDGRPDLVVAADFLTSRLYWNDGHSFTLAGTESGFGTDENGMGLTVGDYDNDGDLDIFVTSISHKDPPNEGHNAGGNYGVSGNRLYRNNADRTFTDVTDQGGVRDGAWGWGASFFDADNDGDLDLIMTNGFEGPSSDFFTDRSRLWINNGDATFTEMGIQLGVNDTRLGKGLCTLDYDNDGDLDIVIVNNESTPILYRNDAPATNAWLKLRLVGVRSNRDAVGAFVSVTRASGGPALVREIDGGSNYLSQNDVVAHLGLGQNPGPLSIDINWPSGGVQRLSNVAPNQTLDVVERRTFWKAYLAPVPVP